MGNPEANYDYPRYKRLLAEAVDEGKRLELIDLLVREKARDALEAQRASDRRVAISAATVTRVLGASSHATIARVLGNFEGTAAFA